MSGPSHKSDSNAHNAEAAEHDDIIASAGDATHQLAPEMKPEQVQQVTASSLFSSALEAAHATAGDGRQSGAWHMGGKGKGKEKGKSKCDGHDPSKGKEKGCKGKSKGDDHDPSNGKETGGKGKSKGDDHDPSNGKEKGGKGKSKGDDHDPIIEAGEGKGKGKGGKGKFDYDDLCNRVWWLGNASVANSKIIRDLQKRLDDAEKELARYRENGHGW